MATTNTTFKEVSPYKSQYGKALTDLTNAVVNRQDFTYDPNTDASYQALAKQYGRLGDRARQNTLGDFAANTGGLASSYAVSAAQQAQNDYNQQLSNMIPSLMEAAYQRYSDNYNMNLNALNAIGSLDNQAYQRWQDNRLYNRNLFESNRDYNRGVYESDRAYNRGVYESNRDYNYQKARDKVADSQWLKQFNRNVYESNRDYNRSVYEDNRNYKRDAYESDRSYKYQAARDKVADAQWLKDYNLDLSKFNWSKSQGNSGSGGGSGRSGGGGGRKSSGGSYSSGGNNNPKTVVQAPQNGGENAQKQRKNLINTHGYLGIMTEAATLGHHIGKSIGKTSENAMLSALDKLKKKSKK